MGQRPETTVVLRPQSDAPSNAAFVAERGGQIVGSLEVVRANDTGRVSFALAEGQPAAMAIDILRAGIESARSQGIGHLSASIGADDTVAIGAFKDAGFYGFVARGSGAAAVTVCERKTS